MQDIKQNATKAESLLKQLANANRLMIMCELASGEKTVNQIVNSIKLSQSAASQHLAKMKKANLVKADKRGLEVYYRICSAEVQAILSVLHLIYCKPSN